MTPDELIRRGREAAPAMLDMLRDVIAAGDVVEISRRVNRQAGPGDQMFDEVLLALAARARWIVAEIDCEGAREQPRPRPFRKDDRIRVTSRGHARDGVVLHDQSPGHTVVAVRFDGMVRRQYWPPDAIELIAEAPTEGHP